MSDNNKDNNIFETTYEELMNPEVFNKHHPDLVIEDNLEIKAEEKPTYSKKGAWYIALTHYLSAGLVLPIVFGLIYTILITPFIAFLSISDFILIIIGEVIFGIGILSGSIYSANYIKNNYFVDSSIKDKVILYSTVYFIIILGLLRGTSIFNIEALNFAILHTVTSISLMILFWLCSKKYVKANS